MVPQKTFDFRPLAQFLMSFAVFFLVIDQGVGYDRFVAWGGGDATRPLAVAMIVWFVIHASVRWVFRNRKRAGSTGSPPEVA